MTKTEQVEILEDIEVLMKQWDSMVGYVKQGKHGSLASDWFYSLAEELVCHRKGIPLD